MQPLKGRNRGSNAVEIFMEFVRALFEFEMDGWKPEVYQKLTAVTHHQSRQNFIIYFYNAKNEFGDTLLADIDPSKPPPEPYSAEQLHKLFLPCEQPTLSPMTDTIDLVSGKKETTTSSKYNPNIN